MRAEARSLVEAVMLLERERSHLARERSHLASDLHEIVAQPLVAMCYRTEAMTRSLQRGTPPAGLAEELVWTQTQAQTALQEVQQLIKRLKAPVRGETGLWAALHDYLRDFRQDTGLKVCLRVSRPVCRLGRVTVLVAYRIFEEALTNVRKHARASRVLVHLACAEGRLWGRVSDDGRGLPPEGACLQGNHGGLREMRQRAVLLGGRLTLRSRRSGGTCVRFSLPLRAAGPAGAE